MGIFFSRQKKTSKRRGMFCLRLNYGASLQKTSWKWVCLLYLQQCTAWAWHFPLQPHKHYYWFSWYRKLNQQLDIKQGNFQEKERRNTAIITVLNEKKKIKIKNPQTKAFRISKFSQTDLGSCPNTHNQNSPKYNL